jgi:hypothetical protein
MPIFRHFPNLSERLAGARPVSILASARMLAPHSMTMGFFRPQGASFYEDRDTAARTPECSMPIRNTRRWFGHQFGEGDDPCLSTISRVTRKVSKSEKEPLQVLSGRLDFVIETIERNVGIV